jgi:DivIVA domain-containing protein
MPPSEQPAARANGTSGDPRDQTIATKLAYTQGTLRDLIVRRFPRSFRGYDRAAVDRHLELIVGWLSLEGLDELVRERFNEQDPLGRQLRVQAESDAEQVRADARREADRRMEEARRVLDAAHQDAEGIKAKARQEANTLLADARADAAAERRDEAARVVEAAEQDAERIRANALQEAETLLADARAEAAAERRDPLTRFRTRLEAVQNYRDRLKRGP